MVELTFQEAKNLISLPKKVLNEDKLTDKMEIDVRGPLHLRFLLLAENDKDYSFVYEVNQSGKFDLKISLHLMDDETKLGLVRVEYHGSRHYNPATVLAQLPQEFHTYAGKYIAGNHIHFHIPGYKSLGWALPLAVDSFVIKEVRNPEDIINAFLEFNKFINLLTKFDINQKFL